MKRYSTSILAVALAGAVTSAQAAEPIEVGAIAPLTGPAANLGISMQQALEIVAAETNAAGGIEIDGEARELAFRFEDSQGRPEVGISAAQKLLVRDDVDAIFHSLIASSVALAVMELAPSFPDKLFMSGQNVSIDIARKIAREPEKYGNVWKPGWNSDAYAATAEGAISWLVDEKLVDLPGRTVAFVVEDTDFGQSNMDNIAASFEAAGWTVTDREVVPVGHADFYPQLSKLGATAPDLVVSVFTAANSGMALVKQMDERKLASLHMGIPYPNYGEFMEGAGDEKDGLLSAPLIFDPVNNAEHKAFAERLSSRLDVTITQDHALGYCIGNVMVDAMKRAGSLEIDALNAALLETDYPCLLGRWAFDPQTHSPMMGADYLALPASQIQGDAHYAIWPPSVATSTYRAD